MCEMAKDELKALSPTTVGDWERAITFSDGAWLIRGKIARSP